FHLCSRLSRVRRRILGPSFRLLSALIPGFRRSWFYCGFHFITHFSRCVCAGERFSRGLLASFVLCCIR
ncbi:unnamed protein product, partial [Amoebophrya sp. A120]